MMIPSREEIFENLKRAFNRASNGRAKTERLDDDMQIIEDIGLSSLDLLELRYELEEQWCTKITEAELMELRTVGDVVGLIEEHVSMRHG